jgi:hypothetical protein
MLHVLDAQPFFDLSPHLSVNNLSQLLQNFLFSKGHTLQKHNLVAIFDVATAV